MAEIDLDALCREAMLEAHKIPNPFDLHVYPDKKKAKQCKTMHTPAKNKMSAEAKSKAVKSNKAVVLQPAVSDQVTPEKQALSFVEPVEPPETICSFHAMAECNIEQKPKPEVEQTVQPVADLDSLMSMEENDNPFDM